ncbi:serpentine type 7TM GPCR chemoreceptor srd domain-containing protein [Ditylenchus destructor]|uniref:Serpentine type 7TM GPCR chemoreceptor srd domain-containing protein n=1 Tax=Ditylenchus destructor TaxID=166010 RepID=A0AAD4MZK4_9BILA|nr:serpentine type 7TM GPCR chemoreceptor srd domain-containing protein [Ditylenchus destructor]
MKVYSKILLQTCIIDFLVLAVIGFVQPIYVVYDGWNMLVPNGPFRNVGHPWNYILMASWFYSVHLSITSNCVPFIYRYLLICRSKIVSSVKYFLMLFVCCLVVLSYMALLAWSSYPREAQRNAMATGNYSDLFEQLGRNGDPTEFKIGLMMKTNSIPWEVTCAYLISIESFSYIIILICGLKIQKCIKENTCPSQLSTRAKEASRQLNIILMLQTLLPILEMTVNLTCLLVSIFSGSSANVFAVVFALLPIHWVPLLNPLITIIVVKPYRNFILMRKKVSNFATSYAQSASETPADQRRPPMTM